MSDDGWPRQEDPDDSPRSERRRGMKVERMGRPRMSDVTAEPDVPQRAVAEAEVVVSQRTLSAIVDGTTQNGDILTIAELAGVMAGKRASDLIPLVHPVPLSDLTVAATPDRTASVVRIRAEAAVVARTGVEMEAMTAASVAALTIYDMVRHDDREAMVRSVRLVSRSSGDQEKWQAGDNPAPAGSAPRARGSRMAGRVGPGGRGGGHFSKRTGK